MKHRERHLLVIAAAISAVGAFFLCASLFRLPFIDTQPPGAFFLSGLSICLLFGGIYYFIKAFRGQLKSGGKTITDVRIQAVEKMQGKELLSRIATEDPDKIVREKAIERLEELAA